MSPFEPKASIVIAERFRLSREGDPSAFGQRWFARDQQTRKQVEVLFLKPSLVEGAEERFRLANAAQTLDHPHAIGLLHASLEPVPLRVTRWEKHDTLTEKLEGQILLSTAVGWARQLANALAEAHRQDIVHGAIAPGAIWIVNAGPSGEARLASWGLIRLLDGVDSASSTTGITDGGNAPWISPEYARGVTLLPASDVYSLGAVLFHAVTGTPPFTGPSMKVAASHVTDAPEPPSRRKSGVPAWLDELILSMLAKDPTKRPTAERVAQKLDEGAALLVDQAAREDRVTANAAPTRLPQVAIRGAHSVHLPEVEPAEKPIGDDIHLFRGLLVAVGVLLLLIIGLGLVMRG